LGACQTNWQLTCLKIWFLIGARSILVGPWTWRGCQLRGLYIPYHSLFDSFLFATLPIAVWRR
jgi:hypothetical protein